MEKRMVYLTFIFASSLLILISFQINNQIAEAASSLKVFVNLQHPQKGMAKICIYDSNLRQDGCEIFDLTKHKTNTPLGPLEFRSGLIKDNAKFGVCVFNISEKPVTKKCYPAFNDPEKKPEYVNAELPSKAKSSSGKDVLVQVIHKKNPRVALCIAASNPSGDTIYDKCTFLSLNTKTNPFLMKFSVKGLVPGSNIVGVIADVNNPTSNDAFPVTVVSGKMPFIVFNLK